MASTAAFHHVEARRHLDRPVSVGREISAAAATTATVEKPKKVDWPQPVRRYVQRAFMPEHAVRGIDRVEMEGKLKETITQANDRDALHTVDWDALPLPQQLIYEERSRADLGVPAASWSEIFSGLSLRDPGLPFVADGSANSLTPRKRKSSDLEASQAESSMSSAPWRRTTARNGLEDRMTFPKPGDGRPAAARTASKYSQAALEKRQRRFDRGQDGSSPGKHPWSRHEETPPPVVEVDHTPIIGRSQKLEKKYFRLTSAPNPDDVRPLPVLQQTLELLKKKWKREGNYSYVCDQFKSLRQDLTVQHIKNDFTVNVYEIHARIALEKGDLGEYNQCQTQLRALYLQQLGGHPMEFKAYRILYFIHTCNRTDMNDVLADLTGAEKSDPAVKHALDVRSALALGNYHRLFRLYLDTPNMGAYLMDMFIVRERLAALANICRAYKPDVRIRFITEELGFESDPECVQFLYEQEAQHLLEERDEGLCLLTGKAGAVFETAKQAAFRKVDIKGQI